MGARVPRDVSAGKYAVEMRKPVFKGRGRPSAETHPIRARPLLYGGLGVLVGFGVAVLVRAVVSSFAPLPPDEPLLTVFVTATLAGGAAGLTLLNLRYKRAESLRAQRIMFDERFQRAAALLGSQSDLEVMAGAQLAGALVRDSPFHAQPAADLLVATLRRASTNLTKEALSAPHRAASDISTANRLSNFLTATVADVTRGISEDSPAAGPAWKFDGIIFGDEADFSGCTFGEGTRFERCKFRSEPYFHGAVFLGSVDFCNITAPRGISLMKVHVRGRLSVQDSDLSGTPAGMNIGLDFELAVLDGLYIYNTSSDGGLRINGARVDGPIVVTDSSFHHLQLIDSWCNHHLRLLGSKTQEHLVVRHTPVRKHVTLADCVIGTELEITDVETMGAVNVAHCEFGSAQLDPYVIVSDDPDWQV